MDVVLPHCHPSMILTRKADINTLPLIEYSFSSQHLVISLRETELLSFLHNMHPTYDYVVS